MRNIYGIIKGPVVTEKSTIQKDEENKVVFKVDRNANKVEIRNAVHKLFNVKVLDVNVLTVKGKKKRMGRFIGKKSDWKKAIVTLKPGESIELFEGV